MTNVWPVGEVPYVALRAGGRKTRLARAGSFRRGNAAALYVGGGQNLAINNTVASTYAQGANVTAIGGVADPANAPTDPLAGPVSMAARVRETTATGVHWLRWSVGSSFPNTDYCASIYVKANGRTRGRIGVSTAGDFSAGVLEAEFDLSAETIDYVNAGSVSNIIGMGMEAVGAGWWRIWIAARLAVNSARVLLMNGASTSYAGSTSAGMDVWCGQIEFGTTPTAPLFAGSRPRHAASIPQNALQIPYDLSNNFAWALTNVTSAALTADRAPDGSFTAFDFIETTATGEHRVDSTLSTGIGGVVTFSIYARPRVAAGRHLILRVNATGSAEWCEAQFQVGSISNSQSPMIGMATSGASVQAIQQSVEYLEDDWIRLRITCYSATAQWNQVQLLLSSSGGRSYAGNTGQGMRLWGAELVSGHEPTDAIVQTDLPDALLQDTGVRCQLAALGNIATYADLQVSGVRSIYWEVTVVEMTTDVARIGFVRPTAVDGNSLGQTANTWALLPNGNLQSLGITVGTGPTYAQGDTLGLLLRWNASSGRYELSVVKNPSGAFALPAPIITTLLPQIIPAWGREGASTQVVLDVNFGQRPFKGIPPAEFLPLQVDAGDFTRTYSSASLPIKDAQNFRASLYGDTYPVALGRLASRPVVRRSVSCWVWGRSSRVPPVSSIALDNADGALDPLVEFASRDRTLALHSVRAAPFAEATAGNRVATAIVDQVRDEGGQLVITARELRDLLTVPVQDQVYPATTPNTAVRGKPRPIALGNVRWAPVVMLNGPLLDFDVHDSASFLAIDEVRQNGALLATPADYAVPGAGGAFGFRRATAVQGKQAVRIRGQTKAGPALIERLPDLLTWLCVTKTARLTAAQLDTAGTIAALDAAAPYTLARYIGSDEQVMASDLLQEIMDSFCGDLYTDAAGTLRAWRLEAPAGTPSFRWTEADLLEPVKRTVDEAKGLTTTIGFARNYCVHSTGEIAGAIQPTTIGSELSLPFQSRTSGIALAPAYRQAVAAEPFVTLLTDGAQAQAEADRVAGIYAVERAFYTGKVMIDSAAVLAINPGAVVWLQVPAHDLRQGKLLRVVSVEAELARNAASLTLWG
jgi:hypothetical protein